jgi:hypothetical protein
MKYFVATVLCFIIVFGAIRSFHIYQIAASTPDQAVSKYWTRITKDSPRKVETVSVVSTQPISNNENAVTVLFHATEIDQDPNMYIVGYAVTKKSVLGWYVEGSQTFGKSPQPDDVLVNLDWFDEKPVIYGQVFLANAARVEAIFSDLGNGPTTVASDIPNGGFVLFGSQYQELLEFKIFDSKGGVIKQFTKDELQNE